MLTLVMRANSLPSYLPVYTQIFLGSSLYAKYYFVALLTETAYGPFKLFVTAKVTLVPLASS